MLYNGGNTGTSSGVLTCVVDRKMDRRIILFACARAAVSLRLQECASTDETSGVWPQAKIE